MLLWRGTCSINFQFYEHPSISAVLMQHLADNYVKPDSHSPLPTIPESMSIYSTTFPARLTTPDTFCADRFCPKTLQAQRGGLLALAPVPTPCIVVADTWPGRLAVLPFFKFICTTLFTNALVCPWLTPLLINNPNCHILVSWNVDEATSPDDWYHLSLSHLEAGGGGYQWKLEFLFIQH
jgi:hypothetical protein